MRRAGWAAVAAGLVLVVVALAGVVVTVVRQHRDVVPGLDVAALPPSARDAVPALTLDLAVTCPELPQLWVIALMKAGADESYTADHLHDVVATTCPRLRLIGPHLIKAGKPATALDGLAVCQVAGCRAVLKSRTGIPRAGEAGCGAACAARVSARVAAVRAAVSAYADPPPSRPVAGAVPQPFAGPTGGGCEVPDPTGTGGCVTPATAWLLLQVPAGLRNPVVTSGKVRCWDAHAWNPGSDHPKGRGCDYTVGRLGHRPGAAATAQGWALANWLRAYAGPLRVSYVIFQGKIWSVRQDSLGWRPYDGAGVYDPKDVTGGHFDHVHVSVAA